jgi:hypothetical protein
VWEVRELELRLYVDESRRPGCLATTNACFCRNKSKLLHEKLRFERDVNGGESCSLAE